MCFLIPNNSASWAEHLFWCVPSIEAIHKLISHFMLVVSVRRGFGGHRCLSHCPCRKQITVVVVLNTFLSRCLLQLTHIDIYCISAYELKDHSTSTQSQPAVNTNVSSWMLVGSSVLWKSWWQKDHRKAFDDAGWTCWTKQCTISLMWAASDTVCIGTPAAIWPLGLAPADKTCDTSFNC